jgi:dTDP-4-dehydrorhamnose reductase
MKIAVIGAGGRLGAALMREYRENYDITGFGHAQLDLANLDEVRQRLGAMNFDVLMNAAAFTNVDACETERDRAFVINAEAPGVLAEICNAIASRADLKKGVVRVGINGFGRTARLVREIVCA